MKGPSVICIFGVAGSGKDTTARQIIAEYPRYGIESFAGPLKKMAELAFPKIAKMHWYGESKLREVPCEDYPFEGNCIRCAETCQETKLNMKAWWYCTSCESSYPHYLTPRTILETLGTEWGRGLYKNIWAEAGLAAAFRSRPTIITDGRFHNELVIAKEMGAMILVLDRGFVPGEVQDHESKAAVHQIVGDALDDIRNPSYDLLFRNSRCSTLDEANQNVKFMMKDFIGDDPEKAYPHIPVTPL